MVQTYSCGNKVTENPNHFLHNMNDETDPFTHHRILNSGIFFQQNMISNTTSTRA